MQNILHSLGRAKSQRFPNLDRIVCIMCALILFSWIEACSEKPVKQHEGSEGMPKKTIEEVLREYTDELMSLSGVVGTGQGLCDGNPCIKVFVANLTPEMQKEIPEEIEGYAVIIEATGEFRAFPKQRDL